MNSLERAKSFLARKASRLALAVVPLAAVAISSSPARAGTIVHLNSGSCNVVSGGGTCGTSLLTPGGNSQINDFVSMFSSGSLSSVVSGSGSVLDVSATGAANSGAFSSTPTTVPVAWDFSIENVPGLKEPTESIV